MTKDLRFLIFLFILLPLSVYAQQQTLSKVTLQKETGLSTQTRLALELADKLMQENPPQPVPSNDSRRAAMHIFDGIVHDTRFDGSRELADFCNVRLERILHDLQKPCVDSVRIYKLYNSGFIVRTPSITLAWDICRGSHTKPERPLFISDSAALKIAEACDIMFLTHNHADHVDPGMVKMFTDLGKPVIAPDEILRDDAKVTHTRKDSVWTEKYAAANGAKLDATVIPGHQDHLQNNIFIIKTPEGLTISSTGDQWLKTDDEWIFALKGKVPVTDVLISHCWARELPRLVDTFQPKYVISSHEDEVAFHGIDHRESFWLSEEKLKTLPIPSYLLMWFEPLILPLR